MDRPQVRRELEVMMNRKLRMVQRKAWSVLLTGVMCVMLVGCNTGKQTDSDNANQIDSSTESQADSNDSGRKDQNGSDLQYTRYAGMTVDEILDSLTLTQKAAQMVLPACYRVDYDDMEQNCYGSILSQGDHKNYKEWQKYIDGFQTAALNSEAGIPFFYGQDDLHGVNYCQNTVIFPHNIGMGAANDEELMYQVGLITADEAKLCHMIWNYSPCIAQSVDPRWGRTYESLGSDLDTIKKLSTAYTRGLLDGGMIVCPKHYFGDGNVVYGTGEDSDVDRLIDRGDAVLSDAEIEELLSVYQAQIDAGVQSIMISHSSVNGVKMHENKEYIELLKHEMGFEGFIVSDWNSVQNTSPATYYDQIVTSVNAGIDMFMEVDRFDEVMDIIVTAVGKGDITEERINDAVRRILKVKMDAGLFDDPYYEQAETKQTETGSEEYRKVAEQMVEESLVLIKNEGNLLPLAGGTSVYIMGPAADNEPAQCGGWTIDWNASTMDRIPGVTTIREGFEQKADEYGLKIIKKEKDVDQADVILLVVGEDAYAEWNGDAESIDLCKGLGLEGNQAAMEKAKSYGKPIVTCIVAGRNVWIKDYIDSWDSVVMCYLPGSEGQGVANVLCGDSDFSGKLPSPWYSSADQIGTGKAWLEQGYGLSYSDGVQ